MGFWGLYIHYRENNAVHSFKLKLKGNCRLYSRHIHHWNNNETVTMNLVTFILINPLNIEKIEPTDDFLPSEEINALIDSIDSFDEVEFSLFEDIFSIPASIQIEISCSNIVSIHLNSSYLLKLETCLETCSNTKSINPQCSVSLSLICNELNNHVNTKNVLKLTTPNLLSHICLTSSEFSSRGFSFLESLLEASESLISFRYPTSLSDPDLNKLLKILPKNIILQTMIDIFDRPFEFSNF